MTQLSFTTLLCTRKDKVAVIQLNRPERMNAVIEEMYTELQQALDQFAADDGIRAVVITGSVLEKNGVCKQAFCAGADLKKHGGQERTHLQKREYIQLAHATTHKLFHFPKPTIAAVNGPARGAGAELVVNCDFVFMAEGATLGFPEIGLGTFIGGGATYHLSRMVGPMKAKALIFLGEVLDGRQAEALGLALKVFPAERLLPETLAFADRLSEQAPISLRLAKKGIQQAAGLDLKTVLVLESDAILTCMDTEDWHEGVRSFNEKRKPVYKGK